MTEDNAKSVLEALIFSSDRPVTLEQMKKCLEHLSIEDIRAKLKDLAAEYEALSRGIRLVEVAGGYQMVTATSFSPFLKKLYKERRVERLSKPALETLAIIAYKQPLTKLEIESLRSVNVDGVMKSLLDKDLIRISGRKQAPGRPFVFGTTKQFLIYFGLNSLNDLPKMEDFSSMAKAKEDELIAAGAQQIVTEEKNGSEGPTQTN
ncbi:MAG: SMC-Scp complex subunit ScpB [Candidatus Omnitrophota bacterium]|jgi:segregation and condensation protein B|nr:MAG: SMC-Scp complex subunit ScpB [Candidatus Omnitrophota bacterium]